MAQETGYASFVRTTILARKQDLAPSITFWRDVMGFAYAGDPEPRSGSASILGWSNKATTYFTSFKSRDGSTVALLLVDNDPDFPTLTLPDAGTAYGGVVLVHTAKNIRDVYDRAVAHGVEIVKPYGPSNTGLSVQIMLRAPTGQMVEVYEMLKKKE
jgi:catechol 2,3-dioxygenase-like lactoylglutathione lyase family enzyme